MSEEADKLFTRKEKRALRDAERFKAGKKRKRTDEEVQDAAAENEDEPETEIIAPTPIPAEEAPEKATDKPAKKRRRQQDDSATVGQAGEDDSAAGATTTQAPSKKKRKPAATAEDGTTKPANSRFIVFLGNLPFSTTDDSLKAHFVKLQPFTLRHRTDPKTKKSKGFAFLEFENYDRMKTCLKLYHHSYFDPETAGHVEVEFATGEEEEPPRGRKDKRKGRKINVELTAGGGGGKENRMEKIKVKNTRLEEQRTRRAEVEKKEKAKKERKEGGAQKGGKNQKDAAEPAAKAAPSAVEETGIHPSRLANMR